MVDHMMLASITVRRLVPLVVQELLIFRAPELIPVFSDFRVDRSLVFYVGFCRSLCVLFCHFLCGHCISDLWLTASDYSYGIFKLFLKHAVCYAR